MVALETPESAALGRRFALPAWSAGSVAGFITGLGLILDFEILVLTSLVTLAAIIKRTGDLAVGAWGAAYVLTSGLWLLPAANGSLELLMIAFGLPITGALFYGTIYIVSVRLVRSPWELGFGASIGLAELAAASLGLSVAPIGLASIGSGAEWLISYLGIYGASAAIAAICATLARVGVAGLGLAIPVAFGAVTIPAVPAPVDPGLEFAAVTTEPDAFGKWSPAVASAELEKMIELSRETPGKLHIWPENAIGTTMRIDRAVSAIPQDIRPVLFGMTHIVPETGEYRNSAVLVAEDGTIQTTSKTKLVPVTEGGPIVPTRAALTTGERAAITMAEDQQVIVLLCYEAAFRLTAAELNGAKAIIVLAAETGFWQPMGSAIMDRHVRAREIETGIKVHKVSDYQGES